MCNILKELSLMITLYKSILLTLLFPVEWSSYRYRLMKMVPWHSHLHYYIYWLCMLHGYNSTTAQKTCTSIQFLIWFQGQIASQCRWFFFSRPKVQNKKISPSIKGLQLQISLIDQLACSDTRLLCWGGLSLKNWATKEVPRNPRGPWLGLLRVFPTSPLIRS